MLFALTLITLLLGLLSLNGLPNAVSMDPVEGALRAAPLTGACPIALMEKPTDEKTIRYA